MSTSLLITLALLSPFSFMLTAILSWVQPGMRPSWVKRMSLIASILAIPLAAVLAYAVYTQGIIESQLLGMAGLGLSVRLDALSALMVGMIALLGFIIIRFSKNYLDGDTRQGVFIGRLAATIASVQLLVMAGNLGLLVAAWVVTSISLQRLLVFYRSRRGAIVAARKKFVVARLSDLSLIAAAVMLYLHFGTGNLEEIFSTVAAQDAVLAGIEGPAILLVLAALFKSAQFPSHGWLIEVMETPTPVSALLHAGLLNAGPFLIVRMAFFMEASQYAHGLLIAVGGITALFGSVVYLTQPSVKTALGYSSIAHMGFSLLLCGLGAYPAAMLHLVAHSFYKAHSFLSSGSVIETIRAEKVAQPRRLGSPLRILAGMLMALAVYAAFALAWGINPATELTLLAIGAVIVLGLTRLFALAFDSTANAALIFRASFFAIVVALAFFGLESGMHALLMAQVPVLPVPDVATIILMGSMLTLFAAVIMAQLIGPSLPAAPWMESLRIHLRNGLYINTYFDKLVGAWEPAITGHGQDNWQRVSTPVKSREKAAQTITNNRQK